MKNQLSLLSRMFGFFVCVTMLCSCGGDDDGSVTPPAGKRLAKITKIEHNTVLIFTYDSQGRVVRRDEYINDVCNGYITFKYTDNKIVEKSYSHNSIQTTTEYTLENGLIVSDKHSQEGVDDAQYTYINNRIDTKTTNRHTYNYIWSGGNLMTVDREGKIITCEYTNIIAPQLPFNFMKPNNLLASYYGMTTKNLPSKFIDDGTVVAYDWTMDGGYPVKRVMTETRSSGRISTAIWLFEWK